MRPRGTALAIAIVCVLLVAGVAALLARSGAARVQARRADVQREAALRRAETALTVARTAVEQSRLKPGGQIEAEGLTVQCAAAEGGLLLTAKAEAPVAPGVTPSTLKRVLRVTWTLKGAGTTWRRTGWSTAHETRNEQPAVKKAGPDRTEPGVVEKETRKP